MRDRKFLSFEFNRMMLRIKCAHLLSMAINNLKMYPFVRNESNQTLIEHNV